jgi:CRP-like cAMP-binding protein
LSKSNELFSKFGKEFPKGTVLFNEGDSSRDMYVIQSGRVEISKKVKNLKKILITLGPGDFFGEMATLNNKPRSACATVIEDSQVLVMGPNTFEAIISSSNEVALRMIKKLVQRIQDADTLIENLLETLLLKDNNSKVVSTLIKLAYEVGEKTPDGIKVKIPQDELAAQTGLEEPKVKEVILELVKREIITLTPDIITISSIEHLTKCFDFLSKGEK